MTLLDRFRAQPRQKHADPLVRLAFVQEVPIDERDLLAEIARDDGDVRVRRAAVAKLMDPSALAAIAAADASEDVRDAALGMLRDIALDAFEGIPEADSLAAVEGLSDPKMLAVVAKVSLREEVALRALGRVSDIRALGSIARHAKVDPIRLAALAAIEDRAELVGVALNSEFKDTAVAAVERLDDRVDLEHIALRGKNKSAVKRARGLLREMDEQTAAAAAAAVVEVADMTTFQTPVEETAAPISDVPSQLPEALAASDEEAQLQEAARLEAETIRAQAEIEEARQREESEALERQRTEERAAQERERAAARAEAEAREARVRQDALKRLMQLAARVEALAGIPDLGIKAGERALRDLRAALADLPPLPSRQDYNEIVDRLKAAQSLLTPKVAELVELADWRRWANLGLQEQLCIKMEALAAVEDPAEIARQVRDLQEQWRLASDVPRPQGEALWHRFKTAHDVVWARCEAHFAAEHEARAANLAIKLALCERAEALAESTQWIQTADAIKGLQSEWQAIGAVPRGQEKAVWQRFRAACDRFFTRRQADLVERKQVWAANLARKEELCTQVEALVDSTEWDTAAATIKRLQNDWKTIGPVKKSRSEAIWQRFRSACDRFFARYAQRHDIARGERVAAREAICTELEALGDSLETQPVATDEAAPAPPDLLSTLRAIRARWQREIDARGVDREQAAALDQRFGAAFARVVARAPGVFAGTDFDPEANRKRMETLVRRMEDLARSIGSPGAGQVDAALSPTNRLAAMLKEALAANTIGGKADDEARMRAALEEVRQAQTSWARIGAVPSDVRRALSDRFSRACRQIAERVQPPAKAGAAGGANRSGGAGRAG